MICDYGCGQEAIHQFKNGNWCCSLNISGCPSIREKRSGSKNGMYGKIRIFSEKSRRKISNSLLGNKNSLGYKHTEETKEKISNGNKGKLISKKTKNKIRETLIGHMVSDETRTKISKSNKLIIEKIKEKHVFFSQIEEMRYNPDTPGEKEIQVHCKNSECEHSKEKGGWFTPIYSHLYERIRQVEHQEGNGGAYFYCCQQCKDECILYNIHSDPYKKTSDKPYTSEEYNIWKQVVLNQDNHECQKCESKKDLHCHHIHPVKTHPHLALDPTNGIVLCKKCHYEIGHKDECNTWNLSKINQNNSCCLGNTI